MLRLHRLRQAGDTIVEIMIVLAVLGLAISISYATADHSLRATRQAQEASQATDILQGQVEALRSIAEVTIVHGLNDNQDIYHQATPFCMSIAATVTTVDIPNPTSPPATCIQGIYIISISLNTAPNQPDTFTFTATWADNSTPGNDTATIVYRVHQS